MIPKQKGLGAIYLILFLMSLSLHVQFPILTPFALALGATSFFISLMVSCSSFMSFWGHLIAGPLIDKLGKKQFIVAPLFLSALLITCYAQVEGPKMLLLLRVINSLALSFLGPASLALLSAYARNSRQQGNNMAIHGLMITLANIVAPIIGGKLNVLYGYKMTFYLIGMSLFVAGIIAVFFVREAEAIVVHKKGDTQLRAIYTQRGFPTILIIGFAIMFGNGTLYFELPFLSVEHGLTTLQTGFLFSLMGLGTLSVLILFGLQRLSSRLRTVVGLILLALLYLQLATGLIPMQLGTTLFCLGAVMGLLFPALTTLLSERVSASQYGSAFGMLSATFSLGFILSSLASGAIRTHVSPYYLAFFSISLAVIFTIYDLTKQKTPQDTFET